MVFKPFCLKLHAESKITLKIGHIQLWVSLQFTSEHELYNELNQTQPDLMGSNYKVISYDFVQFDSN